MTILTKVRCFGKLKLLKSFMLPEKIKFLNVNLPQINKYDLQQKLARLKKGDKKTLYFFYSEFLLRANRNPFYRDVLQKADLSAIDGRGLHWSQYKLAKESFLPKIFRTKVLHKSKFIRVPFFLVAFFLQLIFNIFNLILNNFTRKDFSQKTSNELILGRSFSYDLLNIAEKKGWKTLIMGASQQADDITHKIASTLFPKLNLVLWTRSPNSLLMKDFFAQKDTYANTSVGWKARFLDFFTREEGLLTHHNLFQKFPDLLDAEAFIKKEKPDLILVGIGGGSGKQEFFIDYLKHNSEIDFTLATGLGAAFDHLGTGVKAQQNKIPTWMTKMGLEWLWRLWKLSYRRGRIIDAVVTLWFWTTLAQFMKDLNNPRKTVINIIKNKNGEYLLLKRRNALAGNVAWSFAQGGIEKDEEVEEAGIREIVEETGLEVELLETSKNSMEGIKEYHSQTFLGFLATGCQHDCQDHFIHFVEYSGQKIPKPDFENLSAQWFKKQEVAYKLSPEKIGDWLLSGEIYE